VQGARLKPLELNQLGGDHGGDVKDRGSLKTLLVEGVREGVYPGAVVLVSYGKGVVLLEAVGRRVTTPWEAPMLRNTVFDLASLTKPLATALALMKLVDEGRIDLDEPIQKILDGSLPADKSALTCRLLLCHAAGFADWRPFYLKLESLPSASRETHLRTWLLEGPLTYRPGTETVYSDLGFMMLKWVVERASGMSMPDYLKDRFFGPLGLESTFLGNAPAALGLKKENFAATEDCPWRQRVMIGQVHDENAYALGGYSGHAGLFSNAEEVCVLAEMLLCHFRGERQDFFRPTTVRAFFRRQNLVKPSTWALGWDTPSEEGSSAGRHFSTNSVGHLGFTGTSIWMDLERGVIVVLLTNRIHPTRKNEKIRAFRPRLHDRVMAMLDG
jgi:CubicO group peptidase (beta-lactamase class C family)